MANSEKSEIKSTVEVFYLQTTLKDRKLVIYHKFKDFKINGSPVYTKQGLYKLFKIIDER